MVKNSNILPIKDFMPRLPQPIDYGLTYKETFNGFYIGGDRKFSEELPEFGFTKFTYKQGDWVPFWRPKVIPIWLIIYTIGFAILAAFSSVPGGWAWDNSRAYFIFFLGLVFPGAFFLGIICAVDQSIRESQAQRKTPSQSMIAFQRALSEYKSALISVKQEFSYWEKLNGYEFEIATGRVLELYQFNPKLTGGPADGGIDIKVNRNGLKGVVQCKAHATPIGPHVIRDLFGVMHDSQSDFGIVASCSGFTVGAVEFAKNKSIFLIDVSILVAMAKGEDVFYSYFTHFTDN